MSQAVQTIETSNLLPDPAPLVALLPFLPPAQRQIAQQVIDFLSNATAILNTFNNNFNINVIVFFSLRNYIFFFFLQKIGICIKYCCDVSR